MKTKPQLSIIVPAYKVEAYLPKCIDSILAQTFRDFELILVDDGSTDSTPAICDAAAAKDERVVVIHQKNGGVSAARNAGLDAVRGDYIGFVDSDDYIEPEMYETLMRQMKADDSDIVICNFSYADKAGNILPKESLLTKDELLSREEAVRRLSGNKNWYYVTLWNRLYRREVFENIRFPVGRLHEDEYVAHLLYWNCKRISVIKKQLYFYVQREGSITTQESVMQSLDRAEGFFDRSEFAQKHQLYDVVINACNSGLVNLADIVVEHRAKTPEEEQQLKKTKERADTLVKYCLHIRGYGKNKWKLWLFAISPALYCKALKYKNR